MMKRYVVTALLTCFLVSLLTGSVFAYSVSVSDQIPRGNAYIPKGTLIEAELITGVNSAENDVGDIAYFKLNQNVIINGVVVLPSGTVGNAFVTAVQPANFLGIGGGIELTIRSIQALNGAEVPLTFDIKKYGSKAENYYPYLILGAYAVGAHTLAMYSAAIHGEDREIPVGTKFKVLVETDVDLGCTPDRLAGVMIKLR